jgi:Zn-dependent peptidase ImmA (M78 family)
MEIGVKRAREVIDKYHTSCPYTICYQERITVVECDMKKLSGFICRSKRGNEVSIVINKNLSPVQKILVLSHELGHYYCHSLSVGREFIEKYTFYVLERFERQANEFAITLLGLPVSAMDTMFDPFSTDAEI